MNLPAHFKGDEGRYILRSTTSLVVDGEERIEVHKQLKQKPQGRKGLILRSNR